ncbi:hypothetical protein [Methylobacterium gnaphalii]|uniref:Uncharacterized protein n=1 Tax=Methylobacterium gnaphalii TaxID=1010610 RepID=A0A512JIQ6_9HYPH|nr:hypothetical protein [Methylobacterium gnaphalii]GEP09848.1 hypothetical protein MGN01_16930 [Methylobacterium gnaphalii]GJD67237.1 hypothetical protein MMMDOFMJ_0151 [Methylobacterium gnaphalii]GLS49877.1 hypothetical protein GCM10007885_27290 [Methylobacterium gnaphalii]
MGQPSSDWIASQQVAEQALMNRFAGLDAVLVRAEGYMRRAESAAAALAVMPAGNPEARELEARDLRQLIEIAAVHLANLDRVHLLEEPRHRSSGPQRRGISR